MSWCLLGGCVGFVLSLKYYNKNMKSFIRKQFRSLTSVRLNERKKIIAFIFSFIILFCKWNNATKHMSMMITFILTDFLLTVVWRRCGQRTLIGKFAWIVCNVDEMMKLGILAEFHLLRQNGFLCYFNVEKWKVKGKIKLS